MGTLAAFLVGLVAFVHLLFLIAEMFFFEKVAPHVFESMSEKDAGASKKLAGNMGLYNGFLAAGLILGLKYGDPTAALRIQMFFLICIVIAGVYGAYSLNKPLVLLFQALPAAVALVLLWAA
jgi:putative membrane protein